jgi:hypothetical protein
MRGEVFTRHVDSVHTYRYGVHGWKLILPLRDVRDATYAIRSVLSNCVLRQPFEYYAIQFDRVCVLRIAFADRVLGLWPALRIAYCVCVLRIGALARIAYCGSKWAGPYAIRNTQYAIRNGGQSGLDVKIAVIRNTQYAIRNAGQKYAIRKMLKNTQNKIRCVWRMLH